MPVTLNTNALTTLANVKAELNISASTYDDYLSRQINVFSDYIQRRCNRLFYYQSSITESVSGYGGVRLLTNVSPIISVTSLAFNGTTLDSTTYSFDPNGFLYMKSGFYWTAQILPNVTGDSFPGSENPLYTVVYEAGWVTPQQATNLSKTQTLPYDVEDATIQAVMTRFRKRGQDQTIRNEQLSEYNVRYEDGLKLTFLEQVISQYRRIAVGF